MLRALYSFLFRAEDGWRPEKVPGLSVDLAVDALFCRGVSAAPYYFETRLASATTLFGTVPVLQAISA